MRRRVVLIALIVGVVIASAGVIVLRSNAAREILSSQSTPEEVSQRSAEILQSKIDTLKKADEEEDAVGHANGSSFEVSEAEFESYVLYFLKEHIPAHIDSIDVQLSPGIVASDTQLTFKSNATGNPMVDALVGGTHNLFLKGKLAGERGRGKFDLEEIKVDGIPVPNVLIQTLFNRYVKPKYPEADLSEPFDLPWGIEDLKLETGKVTVVY
jgi:hypothetical protein